MTSKTDEKRRQPQCATQQLDVRAPSSLRVLVRLFSSLEFGLGALMLYQHTPDFAAVKRAVESMCQLSFTIAHLQQIMHLLPGAYALEWKKNTRTARRHAQEEGGDSLQAQRQRLEQQSPVLTLRKQNLPPPHEKCESIEERISLFNCKVNDYLRSHIEAMSNEFPDMTDEEVNNAVEIEKAPLPIVPPEMSSEKRSKVLQDSKASKEQTDIAAELRAEGKLRGALAKPVPQDLISLPEWLINRVRKREVGCKNIAEESANALKKRMLSTLPQLCDQLQFLVIVSKKSIFLKEEVVRRLAVRAPIKGKVDEQLYLLESMVPEWLTVILGDGKEYVRISSGCKYNVVKASLRRAISIKA